MPFKRRHQVAVLGLGRFGSSVARELARLGHEVLAVDASAKAVQDLSDEVTYAAQADIMDSDALKGLGLSGFDTVIVGVSSDLEVSILATAPERARRQTHRGKGRERGSRLHLGEGGSEPRRVPRAGDRAPGRPQLRGPGCHRLSGRRPRLRCRADRCRQVLGGATPGRARLTRHMWSDDRAGQSEWGRHRRTTSVIRAASGRRPDRAWSRRRPRAHARFRHLRTLTGVSPMTTVSGHARDIPTRVTRRAVVG